MLAYVSPPDRIGDAEACRKSDNDLSAARTKKPMLAGNNH